MNPRQKRGGIEEYRHLRQAGGGRAEGARQEGAEAGRGVEETTQLLLTRSPVSTSSLTRNW